MSWSLSASGHTGPEAQDILAAKVGAALREAGEAVSSASFSSDSFSGDPRQLAEGEH